MNFIIGVILFTVFLFLSGIHIYWGLGGKWGIQATIPTKENNKKIMDPGIFECFVVALGLLSFGIFILIKARIIPLKLPDWSLHYGLWAISIIFIVRAIGDFKYVGFFKKVKTTKFGQMDTKYFSPLCLLIGALGITLELIRE